jgi:hypothetical protein
MNKLRINKRFQICDFIKSLHMIANYYIKVNMIYYSGYGLKGNKMMGM